MAADARRGPTAADGRRSADAARAGGPRTPYGCGYHRTMSAWLRDLPRFPLLDGPSPLGRLERFSAALGGRTDVWVKREDLLPLAFGGNKLRNLEFLIGEALGQGADTLVTAGRRWSNHCRLTAAAGARAGLDVHLVLSGPPVDPPGPNQRLDELLGATVHVARTDSRDEREGLVASVTAGLRADGRHPYVIPVGGSGVLGAIGSALAGIELIDQAAALSSPVDTIVLPTATGGTQAGLLVGLAIGRSTAAVRGIAVAHPATELEPVVARLVDGLADLSGAERQSVGPIDIDDRQLGAGYGHPTLASEEAMRLLARTEGILVDPIYTAKALAGLVAAIRDSELIDRRVVFWHAGGTPALFETLADD
jgi:1-aminocyclopropane-1-carboxylate deaminase/D-cysteine desulfhydrase-like pyridoxal-dependent ACC family enzyme